MMDFLKGLNIFTVSHCLLGAEDFRAIFGQSQSDVWRGEIKILLVTQKI